MKRWGAIGLAITALLVGLVAAPGASAHSAQRARVEATVQVNVSPVDRTGHVRPGYEIAATLFGANCWTGSEKVPGAYRCILRHLILDPCWPRIDTNGNYHGSYCLSTPWRHSGIIIRGRHTPQRHQRGRSLWAVHTTDGYGCAASPGANSKFHGQFLFWRCDFGRRWLLFNIDRRSAQWHATEVVDTGGHIHDAHRVGITKAWFGVSPFGLR